MALKTGLRLLILCVIAGSYSPGNSQDCPELAGRWPYGPAHAVAVSGDHAYFGSGSVLMVVDVSNPSSPQPVGESGLPDHPTAIEVSGDYAYITAGSGGLVVVDISEPTNPISVGLVPIQDARDVALSGGFAYVSSMSFLWVVDVSTPSSPFQVGYVSGGGYNVAISGKYAYLADGHVLRVVDVRTPSNPVEIGITDEPGFAVDVAVSGDYAFVSDNSGHTATMGLRVFDVSSPSSPHEIGFCQASGTRMIVLSGDLAYLSGLPLQVVDISDPTSPDLVVSSTIAGWFEVVSEHLLFGTNEWTGLRILDVSTPSSPTQVGSYTTPGRVRDVAPSGDYAYLVEYPPGLRVIDTSLPSAPTEVDFLDLTGDTYYSSAEVASDHLYVAVGETLHVFDVHMPSLPVEVGYCDLGASAGRIRFFGTYAYVGTWQTLTIVDVSLPSAPWIVGTYETPGVVGDFAIANGYAYVACYEYWGWGTSGLLVLDLGTPSSPQEVSFEEMGVIGVVVSGANAYLTHGDSLSVLDISDPSSPSQVGFCDCGTGGSIGVAGGYAYISSGYGIEVVDVSVASAPFEAGFHATPGGTTGPVKIDENLVYLGIGDYGYSVLRGCSLFFDGFESGDTSAWSAGVP
jgi:hypothetical protein